MCTSYRHAGARQPLSPGQYTTQPCITDQVSKGHHVEVGCHRLSSGDKGNAIWFCHTYLMQRNLRTAHLHGANSWQAKVLKRRICWHGREMHDQDNKMTTIVML